MNSRCRCKSSNSLAMQYNQTGVLNNQQLCAFCKGHLKKTEKKAIFTLEHKNGTYEGTLSGYKKEGAGVFYSDDGLIYIGSWHNGAVHGEGVLFFPGGGLYFGRFDKNKLQGIGLIYYKNKDIICGFWKKSRLHGLVYKFNNEKDLWVLEEYENGNLHAYKKQERIVNKIYGFPSFLEANPEVLNHIKRLRSNTLLPSYPGVSEDRVRLVERSLDERLTYMGFANEEIPEGLGIVLDDWKMVLCGFFKNGVLDGLGRINIENGDIYDGNFQKGAFNEKGIYYSQEKSSYIYGDFFKNRCQRAVREGSGFPIYLALNMKKKMHENSANFFDSDFSLTSLDLPRDLFQDCFPLFSTMPESPEFQNKKSDARSLTPNPLNKSSQESKTKKTFDDGFRGGLFRGISMKSNEIWEPEQYQTFGDASHSPEPSQGTSNGLSKKGVNHEQVITSSVNSKAQKKKILNSSSVSTSIKKKNDQSEDVVLEEMSLKYSKEERFSPKIEGYSNAQLKSSKPLNAVDTEKSLLRLRKSLAGQMNLVESFQQQRQQKHETIAKTQKNVGNENETRNNRQPESLSKYLENSQYISEAEEFSQVYEKKHTFGNEDSDQDAENYIIGADDAKIKGILKNKGLFSTDLGYSPQNNEDYPPSNDTMSKYSESSVGSYNDRNSTKGASATYSVFHQNANEGLFSPIRINDISSKYSNRNKADLFLPFQETTPERTKPTANNASSGTGKRSRIFDSVNTSPAPPIKKVDFSGIL